MDSSILSDRAVKGAKLSGQVYRLREKSQDPDLKGFHLIVSAKGSKSFALAYTSPVDHKRRFLTLGAYPCMKPAEARRAARKARESIRAGN